jgi:hypothetical protein
MKTEVINTLTAIKDYLNDLDNNELVSLHNELCEANNDPDNEIFDNGEDFFNTFFDGKVIEAVRAASNGDYNYNHNFVKFNGYGNLESFDYCDDHIDINEIAEAIHEGTITPYNLDLIEVGYYKF